MSTVKKITAVIAAAIIAAVIPAQAGEVGHYAALAWGPWDHLSPAKGTGQVALGGVHYRTDRMHDSSGNNIDAVDLNLDLPSAFMVFKYTPNIDVLGARFSFGIVPAYGKTSINAYLSGANLDENETQSGWQDLNVIPINLTWELDPAFSLSAQYSFWAPTGSYHTDRALNNGFGYWSHDFRITGSYFPCGDPRTLLSVSGLYEMSTRKRGTDILPGDRAVVEVGVSHVFNRRVIAGLLASGNWEATRTHGADASDDKKDRVFSVGPEVTFYIVPEKVSFSLRYFAEFGAKDRTEGQFFYAGIGYQF